MARIDDALEPANEAERLTRRFVELFTAGEREAWLGLLAPNQETRDRTTNAMSSVVETIAVRGDHLALVRWRAISGSGREWDSLHLARWNSDGLNVLNVIFPADQLDEALAELDRLAGEPGG